MKITVHEGNRTDSPRTVTLNEVVNRARNEYDTRLPEQAINLALADFGSFDPQSDKYRDFEAAAVDRLIN